MFLAIILIISLVALSVNEFHERDMYNRLQFGLAYPKLRGKKVKPKTKSTKDKFILAMARVKYAGTGATQISGKIGGTVFTVGGVMGNFMRNWAKPKNRRTAFQQLTRGLFSGISSAYRLLTGDQITAWNSVGTDTPYAVRRDVFGDTRALSGSMAFQRVNNILHILGLTPASDPPAIAASDSPLATSAVADASAQTLLLDVSLFDAGVVLPGGVSMLVYATGQKSNGVHYFGKSKYRLIGTFAPGSSVVALDISTEYLARFPALVEGQNIGFAVELVTTDATNVVPPTIFSKTGRVYGFTTVVA